MWENLGIMLPTVIASILLLSVLFTKGTFGRIRWRKVEIENIILKVQHVKNRANFTWFGRNNKKLNMLALVIITLGVINVSIVIPEAHAAGDPCQNIENLDNAVRVDGVIIGAYFHNAEVIRGEKVYVSISVMNVGNSANSFRIGFSVKDEQQIWWDAEKRLISLVPEECHTVSLGWQVDQGAPLGYYLGKVNVLNYVGDNKPSIEQSNAFRVKISPQGSPPTGLTISVSADKSSYVSGETITVSGDVSQAIRGYDVTIKVLNPKNTIYKIDQPTLQPDGSYFIKFKVGGILGIIGDYTVEANYAGKTARATFEFKESVNHAPIANPQSLAINQNTAKVITLTGSDQDGDELAFLMTNPSHGRLDEVKSADKTSAQITYTPNLNFNGIDSFTFRVSDGKLVSNPATVSIKVNPIFNEDNSTPDTVNTGNGTQNPPPQVIPPWVPPAAGGAGAAGAGGYAISKFFKKPPHQPGTKATETPKPPITVEINIRAGIEEW